MTKSFDLAVVGAGPAGLMAAKAAAEKGLSVVLLERNKAINPIKRGCGMVLLPLNEPYFGEEKIYLDRNKDKIQFCSNGFSVKYEVRAVSAHKLAEQVLKAVREYEEKHESMVFIAVAGRSNALGPLIAGHSSFPVINCPQLSEKFDFMDLLSSLRMPSNVACCNILEPENAALHAVKILAVSDAGLKEKLSAYMKGVKEKIVERDSLLRKEFGLK